MKINDILSISHDYGKRQKDTSVKYSGINAMFDIPYNFRLRVKFSAHMMNIMRAKIGFSCTNYFRLIAVLVFAVTTALNKFRFYSFKNKMINLFLMIKY